MGALVAQSGISGTYIKEDKTTTITLRNDGTFSIQGPSGQIDGKYQLKGAKLQLKFIFGGLPRKADLIVVGSDKLVDKDGKQFLRPTLVEPSADANIGPPRTGAGPAPFTNADVIQLARAGIPDDVIVQKIKSCGCQLDRSTQALIGLKQAGISPAVMNAVMGISPQPAAVARVLPSLAAYELEPDVSSRFYTTDNPFYKEGLRGECTWFAWGRANEKGFSLPLRASSKHFGNAKSWVSTLDLQSGPDPRPDSLAVWQSPAPYGHVAYIEDVQDGYVYFREANIAPCHRTGSKPGDYCGDTTSEPHKGLKKHPLSFLSQRGFGTPTFLYLNGATAKGGTTASAPAQPSTRPVAIECDSTPGAVPLTLRPGDPRTSAGLWGGLPGDTLRLCLQGGNQQEYEHILLALADPATMHWDTNKHEWNVPTLAWNNGSSTQQGYAIGDYFPWPVNLGRGPVSLVVDYAHLPKGVTRPITIFVSMKSSGFEAIYQKMAGTWFMKWSDGTWLRTEFTPPHDQFTQENVEFYRETDAGSRHLGSSGVQLGGSPPSFWFSVPGLENFAKLPFCSPNIQARQMEFDCQVDGHAKKYSFVREAPSSIHLNVGSEGAGAATVSTGKPYKAEHLSDSHAQRAVIEAFEAVFRPHLRGLMPGYSISVVGVTENTVQNTAIADLQLNDFVVRDENVCRFDLGKAQFQHYNDGRWVLTHLAIISSANIFCNGPGLPMNVLVK